MPALQRRRFASDLFRSSCVRVGRPGPRFSEGSVAGAAGATLLAIAPWPSELPAGAVSSIQGLQVCRHVRLLFRLVFRLRGGSTEELGAPAQDFEGREVVFGQRSIPFGERVQLLRF